ncbi:MAG: PepSY-associated TM helix domain-containing protein [Bacteroidota bacterium]
MHKKSFNALARWLHIYLSMFGFAALFFFAFTGITLNHPEWIIAKQKVKRLTGGIDPVFLSAGDSTTATKDYVVKMIRSSHNIKARLSDFRIDDYECSVSFSGPGYSADGFIERSTGSYELTVTTSGLIGVLNDIHKGSDTGAHWLWIIDFSAVVMVVVSLTGFIMIFFLSRRKLPGLVAALIGAVMFVFMCLLCI